ncbi:MAG: hypothetical protein A3J83_04710 [Elusimicrobia bacterium RIFOXYA2_FULL_40_6]|nr:MAG: hypothetical protein A3J83_04710 [Elusimicrobia bacterium RIFOXYA2_FULL_40_6]
MSQKTSILVVDDEQGIRDMLFFTLKQEGYSVITAENGLEGISKFKDEKVDVVISDMKMPVMDGITMLKEIKKIKPEARVIVATGFGTPETESEIKESGAFIYMDKPFNLEILLSALVKAVAEGE